MISHLKIKSLLVMTLSIIIVLMAAIGGCGLFGLKKADASIQTLFNDRLIPANDLGDIRVFLQKNHANLNRALEFQYDEAEIAKSINAIQQNTLASDKLWDKYLSTWMTDEENQLIAKVKTAKATYLANIMQPSLAAIETKNFPALEHILKNKTLELAALDDTLDDLNELQPRQATADFNEAEQRYTMIFIIILSLGISGLIIALLGSRILLRRIINPITKATQTVNAIAHGKLDTTIAIQHHDEIGVLMASFKPMLTNINSLISEMTHMAMAHDIGDIDVTIDTAKFDGDFEEIAADINKMVAGHIALNKKAMACVKAFGEGNFEAPLEQFPGKKAFINDTIEQVRDNLKLLIEDAYLLAAQAQEGNLSIRADANRHQGDFRKIIAGINFTLDAVVVPLKDTIEQISRYSRGDMSGQLNAEYKGDFADLKKRLDYLSMSIKGIIDSCAYVKSEHDQGNIDVNIAVDRFKGDFGKMASNINELAVSHIALNKIAMDCVKEFGEGNFDAPLERFPGKKAFINETIEQVRTNLKTFITDMKHMSAEHDKGDIDVVIDTHKFKGDYKTMAQGVNTMVAGHIAVKKKAMACIKAFGEGDFKAPLEKFPGKKAFINQTIEQVRANLQALIDDTSMLSQAALDGNIQMRADANHHQGGFRRIVEGINATLETIVNPIIVVKSAVDSISTAAKEISAGNSDLSHRTEQQAASLEETASSMEELAATVKQNADNARQANQMAVEASDVAVKGGSVVQHVVTTMYSINESARKIVDIISVIDGIALQTNILALNAAVEAARAGEQGRGFAVVASEVRNLAQRSAAAAKEIKGLISDSVEKVEDGSKLVGEAGKTMDEIVTSVKRVTDIMTAIASASEQQSAGIEQVNMAITQMDEVTQQNAALVEQAAAAAESLEEQAENLSGTVAQFRLNSTGRPTSSPLRKPANLTAVMPHTQESSKWLAS